MRKKELAPLRESLPPWEGVIRVDSTVTGLTARLQRGDVALIDSQDIDRATAQALIEAQPLAVVNVGTSVSGRYPSQGPSLIVAAGIPLLDAKGAAALRLSDGDTVSIDGNIITHGTQTIETHEWTAAALDTAHQGAAENLPVQLRALSAHALSVSDGDAAAVLDGDGLPSLGAIVGPTVVVVAPTNDYLAELSRIKRYLRDHHPAIMAIGSAADEVAKVAYAPAIIVGSIEGVSDKVVKSARHVVITQPDPAVLTRLETLDVEYSTGTWSLRDDDVAIIVAHHSGAKSVITVGVHTQVLDLLERDHSQVAGTVVSRLQVGHQIIDAQALAAVYRHRYPWWTTAVLLTASAAAFFAALWVVPGGRSWLSGVWDAITGVGG